MRVLCLCVCVCAHLYVYSLLICVCKSVYVKKLRDAGAPPSVHSTVKRAAAVNQIFPHVSAA